MISFVSGYRNIVYNHHLLNTSSFLSASLPLPLTSLSVCGVQVAMVIFQSLIRREEGGNLTDEYIYKSYL